MRSRIPFPGIVNKGSVSYLDDFLPLMEGGPTVMLVLHSQKKRVLDTTPVPKTRVSDPSLQSANPLALPKQAP